MNSNNLSPRLKVVAGLVPKGSKVADIGSDHAYLAINLVKRGIAIGGVAGEVAKGPLTNSRNEIIKNAVDTKIDARLGDGLAVIDDADDIDVICIAGMGGLLIRRILDEGLERLKGVTRLVLQPNVGEYELREWLINHNFKITDEEIVAEDFHLYEIIVAEPGQMKLSEQQLIFGPILMNKNNQVYQNKWKKELLRLEKVQKNLESHPRHGEEKLRKTKLQIKRIEEMFDHVSTTIN
ncbi:tRNA (adenine(22)-N(1))-methyltransferase [Pediococcus stilesii]|uniref:Sam-dependent methyltransferase n=1 Tax=Pediococcus stilesii TaxID=331679 RepID=A0A0R2KUL5_9LACO|nr:tRNA (adenine(22)-N(1))-methyltransferase TrmK [Pediococcus stilesii]KRN93179.1 sam-dependent methyltransferase [Pediococcus stilesii]